ncbi:MAG: DoxX family protein [Gemmatimonadaceae bacterium]
MLRNILRTNDDRVMAFLRIALGVVVLPHGAQKVFGWWGGFGFPGTLGFLTQQMNIPAVLALLVFAAEFLGALGLIIGFLSRIAAFGIAVDFTVALFLVHLPNGFFMNWSGQQKGEGIEFFILAISIAIGVMIRGSGALSIDRALSRNSA